MFLKAKQAARESKHALKRHNNSLTYSKVCNKISKTIDECALKGKTEFLYCYDSTDAKVCKIITKVCAKLAKLGYTVAQTFDSINGSCLHISWTK